MRRRAWVLSILAVALLGATLAGAPAASADVVDSTDVQLVNHDADGVPAAPVWLRAVSADGTTALLQGWGDGLTPGDTNGVGDVYLADIPGDRLTRLSTGTHGGWAQALSADGSTALWSDSDTGQLMVTDVASGASTSLGLPPGTSGRALSTDGRVAIVGTPGAFGNSPPGLSVFDRTSGMATPVARRADGTQATLGVDSPKLSGDGSTVVFTTMDQAFDPSLGEFRTGAYRQRVAGGAVERLLESGKQAEVVGVDTTGDTVAITAWEDSAVIGPTGTRSMAGYPIALSADGSRVLYVNYVAPASRLLDLRTGDDRIVAPSAAAAMSDDGSTVAYWNSSGELRHRDLASGVDTKICCDAGTTEHGIVSGSVRLSADGDRLLFLQRDRWGNVEGGPGDLLSWVRTDDRVRVGAVTVDEGAGVAVLPVTLTRPHDEPVTLTYRPIGAWPASDLDGTPGTIVVPAGATSAEIRVPVVDDTDPEVTERYRLEVRRPDGTRPAGTTTAAITIVDNDGLPWLSVADTRASEGAGALTWTLALDRPAPQDVHVDWSVAAGSATPDVDYVPGSGTAVIPAGASSVTVSTPIIDDHVDEWSPETVSLHLDRLDGAQTAGVTATGTIDDDDPTPQLTIGSVSVGEGDGHALLVFRLSGSSDHPLTVRWTTAEDTTVPADRRASSSDYSPAGGVVTFAPGERFAGAWIDVVSDDVDELDESFLVPVTGARGVRGSQTPARVTIVDDDPPPQLTIDPVTVGEGDGHATLTFRLSGASNRTLTVPWTAAEDTSVPADRRASSSDYSPAGGVVTFAPGERVATASIDVVGDDAHELDESFLVRADGTSGLWAPTAPGRVTIVDDDPVAVSVADTHVAEDAGKPMTWTVSLDRRSNLPVTVSWWSFQDTSAPSDRRAAPDKDFKPAAGTITFAPGETSKTVSSLVFDDSFFEKDEWFVVELFGPTGATLGRAKATGTINDDESARFWALFH